MLGAANALGRDCIEKRNAAGRPSLRPVEKPALWNGDDQGNCRRVRREGTTLQERMYHKWTLFVKYFLQTGFRLRSARFLRHAHLGRHIPVHGQLQPGRHSATNQGSPRLPGFRPGKIGALNEPHDAFAVVSRKYFDGGNTPARIISRPTSLRISSAQSAQVNSLMPRWRRAA